MAGAAVLCREGLEVLGHREDQVLFEQPALMSSFAIPGLELEPVKVTHLDRTWRGTGFVGPKGGGPSLPGHCRGT